MTSIRLLGAIILVVLLALIIGFCAFYNADTTSDTPNEETTLQEATSNETTVERTTPTTEETIVVQDEVGGPYSYTVQEGDCIWCLLEGDGWPIQAIPIQVSMVYAVNHSVIGDDPDLIYPGQVLQLPNPASAASWGDDAAKG